MMNHKLVLKLYGVRRPLKFRRRMAREDNRQSAAIVAGDKWWRGRHTRWMTEGNAELLWLEECQRRTDYHRSRDGAEAMSRTPKRGKPPGYEFWGRRKGRGYWGKFGKKLAAIGDRVESKDIIRKANRDRA